MKNKRGFTLMETVIALTIIVIVSVATLTIVLTSNLSTRRATERQVAAGYTADLVTCYRATDDPVAFFAAAAFALNIPERDIPELSDGEKTSIPDTALSVSVDWEANTMTAQVLRGDSEVLSKVTFHKGKGGAQ